MATYLRTGASDRPTVTRKATKTTPAAAPSSWDALISAFNQPPQDYTAQASAMAGQDIAAQTDAIRQQQAALMRLAGERAAQQQQLGLATSKYLNNLNLGGLTAGDFADAAAAAERAAAQGYSGGLQQTVSDAAQQIQQHLAGLGGSPAAVQGQGTAAGNALYGLSGNLPAERLDVAGPLVASTLRALPAQNLAYGQAQAAGALGAGQQQAAQLEPDIAAANAKRASLTAGYLKDLSDQARQAGNDRFSHLLDVLKFKADQDAAAALDAWRQAQVDNNQAKLFEPKHLATGDYAYDPKTKTWNLVPGTAPVTTVSLGGGGVARVNPDGTLTTLRNPTPPKAPSSRPVIVGSDRSGRFALDPATGALTQLTPPVPATRGTKTRGKGGLPPSSWSSLVQNAAQTIAGAGKPPERHYDAGSGTFVTVPGSGQPRTPYPEMVQQITAMGPDTAAWRRKAVALVQADPHYKPGENGRPFEGGAARQVAGQFVREAVKQGADRAQIIERGQQLGVIPVDALMWALSRFYREPGTPIGVKGPAGTPTTSTALTSVPTGPMGPVSPAG